MGLSKTVEPAELLYTLGEIKDHLRIDHDDEDANLERLNMAISEWMPTKLRRSLIDQTFQLTLDSFWDGALQLPFSPLQSVTQIQYVDTNGATQTWASTEYGVFTNKVPGEIELAFEKSYPSIRNTRDAVTITYVAGYGKREDVPGAIKAAGLLVIGHLHERREETEFIATGDIIKIPMGFDALVGNYRIFKP